MVTLHPLDDTGRGAALDWLIDAAVEAGVPRTAVRVTGDAVVSVAIDRENAQTASLCVSQVRPVWQFGLYGAIGTCIGFAGVFIFLPALLQTFPPPPQCSPSTRRGLGGREPDPGACLPGQALRAAHGWQTKN